MDRIRQILAGVNEQLSKLTAAHKMLIASVVVVLLMTLFVVSQYAGGRTMSPLMPGASQEQQVQLVAFLEANNIPHADRNGQVVVPSDQLLSTVARLGEQGQLPSDTVLLFSNLLDKQSWTSTNTQQRQHYNIALQNELARVIAAFNGIRSATVLIDVPESGIGVAQRVPTASATVFTASGAPISQNTVDAIASLIAGAKAGLNVRTVKVIDGGTGTQHRARDEDALQATAYFEHATTIERSVRGKLLDLLNYIDGVVIAVNAQVDIRKIQESTTEYLEPGSGTVTAPESETTNERREISGSNSGEAGVRSNAGLDIAQGGGDSTEFTENITEATSDTRFGQRDIQTVDPRGMPTKINATINVPRSYFIRAWRITTGAEDDAVQPSDAELTAAIAAETQRIQESVEPQLETAADGETVPGNVFVSMIPDLPTGPLQAGVGGGLLGTSGGGGGILASGLVKTVGLGALAVVSLALMVMSLRKATKPQDLPTAEELVGLPPALATDNEMYGEADEAATALAGLELSDDELQIREKVERVAEMVKDQPAQAATLLKGWINETE